MTWWNPFGICALILLGIYVFFATIAWYSEGTVLGPFGRWLETQYDKKTSEILPKEMRELSVDDLAFLYTANQLTTVYTACGKPTYPRKLETAIRQRRATEALKKLEEEDS